MLKKIKELVRQKYIQIKDRLKRISVINILWIYHRKIGRGHEIYKSLMERYGKNVHIYIEHYPGTGDIYITCALLEAYRKRQQVTGEYVLTVIGQSGKKIAKQLGVQNVELLSQDNSDYLIYFLRFVGAHNLQNIEILHYCPVAMHTCILDTMAGYQGLDFMSMYLNTVFPGVTWADATDFEEGDVSIAEEYLDAKGLIPGKTVVLFPFANTIQDLPWHLWEELARHLREKGFTVCTNIEPGRVPVPGTVDIFVPYQHLKAFIKSAGYVIGIRSGIFDIIANVECKKFIMYPTPNIFKFGVDTIFEYFSLRKMGICSDVYEYDFERIYDKNAFRLIYRDLLNCQGRAVPAPEMVEDGIERHVHFTRPKMNIFEQELCGYGAR